MGLHNIKGENLGVNRSRETYKMKPEIKEALRLPEISPMDIILHGLRPTMDDEHEKKKLDERDEMWKGKLTIIPERRNKDG